MLRKWGWLAAVGVAAGCTGGPFELPANQAIQQRVQLESFKDCAALEQNLEDRAVLEMKAQIAQSKRWVEESNYWGWWGTPVNDMRGGAEAGAPAPVAGPTAYTTTNTQVLGVDEADFVKNDGTRIFVLSGDTLYLNQSWPADQLKLVSKLKLEGSPREMFLDEKNRLVVFSGVYLSELAPKGSGSDGSGGASMTVDCAAGGCHYWYANAVKTTVIDVANLAAPKVLSEEYLPGNYYSARRIGSAVRIVLGDYPRLPAGVRYYPDYDPLLWNDKGRLLAAYDALVPANEKLIRAQPLAGWLPKGFRRNSEGAVSEVGYRCEDFHASDAPTQLGLLTVATLNLEGTGDIARTTVLAQPGIVYSSAQHLYVASWHWWWWPEDGQTEHTYLHKFDISKPDKALYVASGGVEGHLLDQFSMDEHQGFLRVGTNLSRRVVTEENWWGTWEWSNRVSVLGEVDGQLKVVGQTGELAANERIQSSRFIGDRAYVVTFRQIDPFFTLDVSNPADPKVVGELKIPGFSTYLHPVDANHILAMGVHQDVDGGWGSRSLKLSLFDVTDFANPQEKFTQLVGSSSSWSEAMWDHRAFNYFPEKKLLAIPFSDWSYGTGDYWGTFTSDLRVFGVDTATGFTSKGALSLQDLYAKEGYADWYYYWQPRVRRSVMADDFVYAIGDAGIRSAHVSDLTTPLATVEFNRTAR